MKYNIFVLYASRICGRNTQHCIILMRVTEKQKSSEPKIAYVTNHHPLMTILVHKANSPSQSKQNDTMISHMQLLSTCCCQAGYASDSDAVIVFLPEAMFY